MSSPGAQPVSLATLAGWLAATALDNVVREFPNAPAHVALGPDDVALHRRRHPAFYGAYDWHSAVHMHWLLVRLLRLHPRELDVAVVRHLLNAHLTPEALRDEADYLRADPSFERPYGWAWLVTLAAECAGWEGDAEAAGWARALRPAVETVADLILDWLPRAAYPVRDGGHANTAFSLGLILDATGPLELPHVATTSREWAARCYLPDRDVPASWEPSGQDFLSPSLSEADLVRRLLPRDEFSDWLTRFLPGLADGQPRSLLWPVGAPDRDDGQLGHLDGLNFSRADALRAIGSALHRDDQRRLILLTAAARHVQAALPSLSAEAFSSSHWLGSFAALALADS
jgi:hypothetical protein